MIWGYRYQRLYTFGYRRKSLHGSTGVWPIMTMPSDTVTVLRDTNLSVKVVFWDLLSKTHSETTRTTQSIDLLKDLRKRFVKNSMFCSLICWSIFELLIDQFFSHSKTCDLKKTTTIFFGSRQFWLEWSSHLLTSYCALSVIFLPKKRYGSRGVSTP